jgi:DeoR/GlpR family transcriptional regulator of sugar metabolism
MSKAKMQAKAWNYMRRNRRFRIGDIMVITDISKSTLRRLLRKLIDNGQLTVAFPSRIFKDREYLLLNDTGVRCP